MAGKFELYEDKSGEYRFRLKAGNGENVGASEGYNAKASALNGIESVKKNAANDDRFSVFEGKNDKWYFNLKAGNHEVILSSQGYSNKSAAEDGTSAVQRATADASVDDQTG